MKNCEKKTISSLINIAYLGGAEFAVAPLTALAKNSKFALKLVACPKEQARDRGMKTKPGFIANACSELNLTCIRVENNAEILTELQKHEIDFLVVCAFGLKLSLAVLDYPKVSSINIHASLLPRWRGAAPIVRAIEAGDSHTGVTIMQMAEKIDAGAILLQEKIAITADLTAGNLYPSLSNLGAKLIQTAMIDYQNLTALEQDLTQVSYAKKLNKDERKINWHDKAAIIEKKIRAFAPKPGLYTQINEQQIIITQAKVINESNNVASLRIVENSLIIACGEDSLEILSIKPAGKNEMLTRDWINGLDNPQNLSINF